MSAGSAAQGVRLAIDIGGTFTDLEYIDPARGGCGSFKVATTPEDFSIGFMNALTGAAARFGFALSDIRLVMHGTTIATNAVLTRNLPDGALITTAGFEDVLEIGRHARKDVYGLMPERRSVLVPRRRRFGVLERVGAGGEVVHPLDRASLDAATDAVAASGAAVVAVALINAYLNPSHEIAIRDHLKARLPALRVSCSHEVSPEIREFERTSTTVLNALLMPVVQTYIARLSVRMAEAGLRAPLYLVQSNGGAATPETAALTPVKLLLSGPSGGVLAAERLAGALGLEQVVAVDMGGTSYDVAVIQNGLRAAVSQGEVDGLPVRVPMVDMRTIGAGGGSIAAVDASGRLRVGPGSAGAQPGPVCYRRGGDQPTTTDANVILGRIAAGRFMNGAMALDADAARAAFKRRIADPLGLALEPAAEGVLDVVTAKLAGAIKLSLFERGLDPRDFVLMSFGGAGGLHAVEVADELGMRTVVFPGDPSTFSAHGILQSDITHDLAKTRITPLTPAAIAAVNAMMTGMADAGRRLLAGNDLPAGCTRLQFGADLRYRGQAFELMVPIGCDRLDAEQLAAMVEAFHRAHLARFSFDDRGESVEMVTLRLVARGILGGVAGRNAPAQSPRRIAEVRPVYLRGRWRDIPVLSEAALAASRAIDGPAVIEQDYTTLLLTDGWRLELAPGGAIIAAKQGRAA